METKRVLSRSASAILFISIGLLTATFPAAAVVCTGPEGPAGTTQFPPAAGCSWLSVDPFLIQDNFPAGTQIDIDVEIKDLFAIAIFPGGALGGEIEQFQAIAELSMSGTGALAGFNRTLFVQLTEELHAGPRTPGDAVQNFPTDLFFLQGELFGDPDFDFLRIEAGTAFGLPSPGQTTLTDLGGGLYNIDSFFDVSYRITFQGSPGSILEGFGGTTESSAGIQMGEPAAEIPTVNAWGLILVAISFLLVVPFVAVRRRWSLQP